MDGQDLQEEIARLRNEINDLSRRLGEIEGRLLELSRLAASAAGRQRPAPPTVPPVPPRTAPAPPRPEATPLSQPLREVLESVGRVRAAAQAQAERPRPSLEQRLGVSWLSRIGILVLILGAVFFFQYAVQQGWISKPVRVACGVLAGLALLGAGEWALRKGWRIFAASLTGGGIALLYLSVFAASPNWLKLIGTRAAFACMCLVTVIAVALSLRSRMLAAAVLAQVGAYLTPILLRTGQNEQVALMTYLLAAGAGFLLLAALKRWQPLGPVALGGTAVVFALWFDQYQAQSPWAGTAAFAWGFFALFGVYALLATALKRAHQFIGIALVAAAGGLQALLWLGLLEEMADGELLGFLIALDAIALGVCLLRGWHWLRAGAAAWTIVLMSWAIKPAQIGQPYGYSELWAIWAWLFFMVFTADVLVRAWWRRRETKEWLDAGLAAAATGIMFGATYGLLRQGYKPWMGAYTAALAAFVISLAWALRRRAGRRVLSYAYLAEGLVLLTLAMPIQFDKATLTIAWAAQSTVAMLLARRLEKSWRWLISQPLTFPWTSAWPRRR